MRVGQFADGLDDLVGERQQYLVTPLSQHQAVRQIVDVFRGTGEVHEFADVLEFSVATDLFLDQVLDGFDVVIGRALDFLDALCVDFIEVVDDSLELTPGFLAESRYLGDARVGGEDSSQWISTVTRARIRPYSLKTARKSVVLLP